MNETIDSIIKEYENGGLVYIDREGKHVVDMGQFCEMDTKELLSKTNRTYEVLLNLAKNNPNSLKWVNDFAMAHVIEYLKHRIAEQNNQLDSLVRDFHEQQQEIETLTHENNELKKSTANIEFDNNELNEWKEKYANMSKQYELFQVEKQNSDKLASEAYDMLKVEFDKVDAINADLELKFKQANERYEQVNAELIECNEKLSSQITEYENCYQQLIDNEAKTAQLENENDEYKRESAELQNTLAARIEDIRLLEERLHDEQTKYNALNDDYKNLKLDYAQQNDDFDMSMKNYSHMINQIREIVGVGNTFTQSKNNNATGHKQERMGANQVVEFNTL